MVKCKSCSCRIGFETLWANISTKRPCEHNINIANKHKKKKMRARAHQNYLHRINK